MKLTRNHKIGLIFFVCSLLPAYWIANWRYEANLANLTETLNKEQALHLSTDKLLSNCEKNAEGKAHPYDATHQICNQGSDIHARTDHAMDLLAQEKAELQAYVAQAKCVDRCYPFFATQKSVKHGFSANSLTQTLALLYRGAGLEGASSHSGRRSFLTNLANKGTSIHLLKTLAGHRSIQTTAAYLYSSPTQLRAVVELV